MDEAAFYEHEGRRYDRVTSVLKTVRNPGLEEWRGRVGNREANKVSKDAALVGTKLHAVIQHALTNGSAVLPARCKEDQLTWCLKAFQEWVALRKPRPLWIEKRVFHSHGFAGTVDLIEDGVLTDWKTSRAMSDLYWLQLNAYAGAVTEFLRVPISRLRVVRLDKNIGVFEEEVRDTSKELFQAFLGLHNFYRVWTEMQLQKEGCDDWSDSREGSVASALKKKAIKTLGGPEVLDAGAGKDRQVGFLEPW